jgi:UTP-glucose-1-phosphate uridylyltransferase
LRVIIPAGGQGLRFDHLNLGMPKEMLPLGGRPLIAHALDEAARGGFSEAVVVISPEKDDLRKFLEQGPFALPVLIRVQPEPLGIGDAVLRACDGEQPMGVLLPDDVVLESSHWAKLLRVHRESQSAALCVRPIDQAEAHRFGIVVSRGSHVTALVEKPVGKAPSTQAIFGRYVVTDAVVTGLRAWRGDGELQLTYGFQAALEAGTQVMAVQFAAPFYDCGTPEDYARSQAAWERNRMHRPDSTPPRSTAGD